MQEPLFDIFGTKHRESTLSNRQFTENFKGSNVVDAKAGATKSTHKKALVDVKNRLALAPVTDSRAGVLKPNNVPAPAFSKTKPVATPFRSPVLKPAAGKKEPPKSDSSAPFSFLEQTSKTQVSDDVPFGSTDMGAIPFEDEDDYEDLMPKSERFTTEQIHKLVNYWELTRPPLSSTSPPSSPVPLDVSIPEVEVPDISTLAVPTIKVQPVPPPSFQVWEDDSM